MHTHLQNKGSMKTRLLGISMIVTLMLLLQGVQAQVSVTATIGTMGPTPYTTVKGAFDAINAGTHQGVIAISIIGDPVEAASAVLNASGAGSAAYTSISMQPSGGFTRTISGAIVGLPLIDFNGADNVTVDGLNSGGNALVISNTSTSSTSGTSTIRFQADATSNTVTRCSVLGSATIAVSSGTNGGNIWFGAAAVGTLSHQGTKQFVQGHNKGGLLLVLAVGRVDDVRVLLLF